MGHIFVDPDLFRYLQGVDNSRSKHDGAHARRREVQWQFEYYGVCWDWLYDWRSANVACGCVSRREYRVELLELLLVQPDGEGCEEEIRTGSPRGIEEGEIDEESFL